jgi:NADH-quinone oxidoreductase subunit J
MSAAAVVFYALAAAVVISALGVALARSILSSALSLLGTLGGVAGLYLWIGADFLGIAQILIYVGGVLVLVLFAILMTHRIGDSRLTNLSAGATVAAPSTIALGALLMKAAAKTPWRETEAAAAPTTARLGDALLDEWLLPFEVASLVLLLALVGAMVIARRAARQTTAGPALPSRGSGETHV